MARELPIARIRLARSLPRMLAWPAVLVGLGLAGAIAGWLMPAPAGTVLIVAAVLLGIVAIGWAASLLSVRLEVEESEIRVSRLGGGRRFVLSPGPVTRVRFTGDNASRLRVRRGFLGYGLGPARLRDDETIEIVRLAPTPSAILVPTEAGRLAIAAQNDEELLDALSRAARARQRLEDLGAAPPPAAPESVGPLPEPMPEEVPPPAGEVEVAPEARPMTGIERALYERRLAAERAALEEAAEADRLAAVNAAEHVAPEAVAPESAGAVAVLRDAEEHEEPAFEGEGDAARRRWSRPTLARLDRSTALPLVPLAASVVAWGAGLVWGEMPDPGDEVGRIAALALVLAGPGSALGVIAARARWPRLVGVVATGGVAASVLIARALIGSPN